jgi:hypothetical protein
VGPPRPAEDVERVQVGARGRLLEWFSSVTVRTAFSASCQSSGEMVSERCEELLIICC